MLDTSIAVVDGNPAIAYTCSSDLKYARATTSTGGDPLDWVITTTYDDARSLGSLAVIDGNPAIAFSGWTDDGSNLKYIRSMTSTGASASDWSQLVTVDDSALSTGLSGRLAVVYGCPAILYCDNTNSLIKYVTATTSTGADPADWSHIETVVGEAGSTRGFKLAVVNGNPAITFFQNLAVKYAYYLP